jgi:hypothetical protein
MKQAEAGRLTRGSIACTGSPITPTTPLAWVRQFIELGYRSWARKEVMNKEGDG